MSHYDMVIVGAGLSGIGAAVHLQKQEHEERHDEHGEQHLRGFAGEPHLRVFLQEAAQGVIESGLACGQ